MLFLLFLGTTLGLSGAYYQIEDIPIEHFNFDHGDLQNNAMDIELMPRFQKSIHITESDEDPKEYFFRSSYSQFGDSYFDGVPSSEETSSEDKGESKERYKRETTEPPPTEKPDRKSIVTTLGKPLELAVMDPEDITEKSEEGVVVAVENDSDENTNFLINDFIRFKRAATTEKMEEDTADVKKLMQDMDERNKSKSDGDQSSDTKPVVEEMPPHTEKLVMNHPDEFDEDELPRETRGATKDQWVKQLYPVRRRDELEDNTAAAAAAEKEFVRAPRVHFVTQGMSESSPRYDFYSRYDREGRARDLNKELTYSLGRDPYRDMNFYQDPGHSRHYVPPPQPSHSNYRNDRYYNYDTRDRWDEYAPRPRYRDYRANPYGNYNQYDNTNNYNNYSGTKGRQRRIVYYATLPEISRTPPSVNLRDRYGYRDRTAGYRDDRYFAPDTLAPYQLRKPYTKARYEENDSRKAQYPIKAATDVNVREVKKNPEGRIYSEVESNRFPQNNQNYRNDGV
ncbi:hypothetical protein NQ315_003805 [Exocentrus adspersus]|uniref:Uncharacterized protein n=1 Tax=Exocentrus adspersus TaxID=1586481 RepID=A0AAV8VDR9_9CUCU|nr:hypothetical protein NQ315_003805 [Exocentrus adspersus]